MGLFKSLSTERYDSNLKERMSPENKVVRLILVNLFSFLDTLIKPTAEKPALDQNIVQAIIGKLKVTKQSFYLKCFLSKINRIQRYCAHRYLKKRLF